MTVETCINEFKENLKDVLTDNDVEQIGRRLQDAAAKAADNTGDLYDKLTQEAETIKGEIRNSENLRKFNFYRNIELRNRVVKDILDNKDRARALREVLQAKESGIVTRVGSKGTRASRELKIAALKDQIYDGFKKKLADRDLLDTWNSKEFESDIAKSIATGEHPDEKISSIGEIVNETYDMLDRLYNRNGVFIPKLEGRIAKNYHVPHKLLKTATHLSERTANMTKSVGERRALAMTRWRSFIKPLLDLERTFGKVDSKNDEKIDKILREIWQKIVDPANVMGGSSNIANRLSAERVLHWKDPDAALAYLREYGMGTLHDSIDREFQSAASDIATLETYGPNRNAFLDNIGDIVSKQIPDVAGKENVKSVIQRTKNIADQVDGKLDAASSSIAMIGGNIRAGLGIVKLGGVILRSLPDLAQLALEGRRVYGGYLHSVFATLGELVKPLSKSEKALFGDLLKSHTMSEIGNQTRWFSADDAGVGLMSKLQRLSFKLNLLHYWDKGNKVTINAILARHLAMNKNLSFEQIIENDRKFGQQNVDIFRAYNITGDEWDAFRKTPIKLEDNKGYLLPESAREISDEDIKEILRKEGRKRITQNDIKNKRDDIEFKFLMYFKDREDHVILKPSAAMRNLLFANQPSGTILGQVMRMVMQFKMYSASYLEKPVANLLYRNGAENLWQAVSPFKNPKRGDIAGLSQMIMYGTLLGYLSSAASNFSKGISAPSLEDPSTYTQALANGGGLGIYTDLLFSGDSKYHGSTLSQLAGPVAGEVTDFFDTFIKRPAQGNWSTNQAWHFIKGNIPGVNMFYTKWLLDHFILNRIQESISPGYFNRKRHLLLKKGQDYILPPT